MSERFARKMTDPSVAKDATTLADFIQIWCDGHHRDLRRRQVDTEGAALGVYGRKRPVLCDGCEAHLAYAEKRRAFCGQEPKPFCSYCEVHCYVPDEREWQRMMMRYSGPRSWRKGHAVDGIRHMLEGRRHRKLAAAKAAASHKTGGAAAPEAATGPAQARTDPEEST